MKTSQEIKDIASALSEAQKEVQKAHKDSKNPFYKSSYADLSSNWDACREALTKNKLSVTQTTASIKDDTYLITRLMHTSGQWIESRMKLLLGKKDMQGLGSAITYARRYHLQALVGIAPADDDGNEASQKVVQTSKPKKETSKEPEVKKTGKDWYRSQLLVEANKHFENKDLFKAWRKKQGFNEDLSEMTEDEMIEAQDRLIVIRREMEENG